MCESKVYLREGVNKKKIADEAITVLEDAGCVEIIGLFGEKVKVEDARIAEVDARKHIIYLQRVSNDEDIQA